MTVALDGPAGVGKSTIARSIAEKWNFFNLNSGSFYRAITYNCLLQNVDMYNKEAVIETTKNIDFEIKDKKLYLNRANVESFLRLDSVEDHVARISSITEVRDFVNINLRIISKSLDLVAEGRDMTTVVFPEAEVKVFLDASVEKRAERRFKQGSSKQNYEELLESIAQRDKIDRNKKIGSLKIADDAIYLDTSHLTIDEVCEKVSFEIRRLIDSRRF